MSCITLSQLLATSSQRNITSPFRLIPVSLLNTNDLPAKERSYRSIHLRYNLYIHTNISGRIYFTVFFVCSLCSLPDIFTCTEFIKHHSCDVYVTFLKTHLTLCTEYSNVCQVNLRFTSKINVSHILLMKPFQAQETRSKLWQPPSTVPSV